MVSTKPVRSRGAWKPDAHRRPCRLWALLPPSSRSDDSRRRALHPHPRTRLDHALSSATLRPRPPPLPRRARRPDDSRRRATPLAQNGSLMLSTSSLQTKASFQLRNVILDKVCGDQQHMCPCCGSCVSNWALFKGRAALCPVCGTLERHRTVCFDFITYTPSQLLKPDAVVAYFGPHVRHTKTLRSALPPIHVLEFDFFYPGYSYSRTTIQADLQSIPLRNNTLDGVIVLHVLEHVPMLIQAVRELSRVVRRGGFVQQETPCYDEKHGLNRWNNLTFNGVEEDCAATRKSGTPGSICVQKDHLHGFSCTYLLSVFENHSFRCRRNRFNMSNVRRFGLRHAAMGFRCNRK